MLEAFRADKAPPDAISHSWHPKLIGNADACFRMYCLRNIGPCLVEIRKGLPDKACIYYQDITNTSVQFPYIDQITSITPGFDWRTYYTFFIGNAGKQPQGNYSMNQPHHRLCRKREVFTNGISVRWGLNLLVWIRPWKPRKKFDRKPRKKWMTKSPSLIWENRF